MLVLIRWWGLQLSDWSDWGAGGYMLAGSCVGCPPTLAVGFFRPLGRWWGGPRQAELDVSRAATPLSVLLSLTKFAIVDITFHFTCG